MTQAPDRDPNQIDARPTKEFFIEMLVKDISLVDAIMDLIDNSVDGARRLRPNGDYSGLEVRLQIDETHFRIADNCGGIQVAVARDYAFRFGRPADMPDEYKTAHSAGRFGVGMKRALFKIGRKFRIDSTTTDARFTVDINVDQWLKDRDNWQLGFASLDEQVFNDSEVGTEIEVSVLHDSIAATFGQQSFLRQLQEHIRSRQTKPLQDGLTITLNGVPAEFLELGLLADDELRPAHVAFDAGPLRVRIYAGVARSEPREAGWYVFCNGRVVLQADKSAVTGWGEGEEHRVPRYHNQYARFRGYAFMDADRAEYLPWNTTKTGVDLDAPAYRAIRLEMVKLMVPVIRFLDRLKDEKEDPRHRDAGPMEERLGQASTEPLAALTPTPAFKAPALPQKRKPPKTGRVRYDRPIEQLEWVMEALGVRSYVKAGEGTFEYFLKMEGYE